MATVASDAVESEPKRNLATDPIRLTPTQALAVANQPVTYVLPRLSAPHTQPVFIQFAGFPRPKIAALNAGLRNAGWNVQGDSGERLPQAVNLNEVRWNGSNEQAAKDLAAAIEATNVVGRKLKVTQASVGSTNLEVWISR